MKAKSVTFEFRYAFGAFDEVEFDSADECTSLCEGGVHECWELPYNVKRIWLTVTPTNDRSRIPSGCIRIYFSGFKIWHDCHYSRQMIFDPFAPRAKALKKGYYFVSCEYETP